MWAPQKSAFGVIASLYDYIRIFSFNGSFFQQFQTFSFKRQAPWNFIYQTMQVLKGTYFLQNWQFSFYSHHLCQERKLMVKGISVKSLSADDKVQSKRVLKWLVKEFYGQYFPFDFRQSINLLVFGFPILLVGQWQTSGQRLSLVLRTRCPVTKF